MKKGFTLITVLAVLIMVALGAAAILQALGSHINMKTSNLQDVKAQYVAEAGMQYALWRSRNGFNPASENHNVTDGTTGNLLGTAVITKTSTASGSYNVVVTVNY